METPAINAIFALTAILWTQAAWAAPAEVYHIVKIADSHEILVDTPSPVGTWLSVMDQDAPYEVIGYAQVVETGIPARARVLSHSQNALFRVGDRVVLRDMAGGDADTPGRDDLLVRGGREISARYKPLFLQGTAVGQTAESLNDHEFLIDLVSTVYYGWGDRTTVYTTALEDAAGILNVGVKRRMVDFEDYIASLSAVTTIGVNHPDRALQLSGYLDSKGNGKWRSFSRVQVLVPFQLNNVTNANLNLIDAQSSLQTGSSYIFDNWNRLLLGPKYYIQESKIGGYLGYMMIWDHVHVLVGFNIYSFTNFRLGGDGYAPMGSVYWRF